MHPLLVVIVTGLVSVLSFVLGLLQRPAHRVRGVAPLHVGIVGRAETQGDRV